MTYTTDNPLAVSLTLLTWSADLSVCLAGAELGTRSTSQPACQSTHLGVGRIRRSMAAGNRPPPNDLAQPTHTALGPMARHHRRSRHCALSNSPRDAS